jgi:hypothetical protein
MPWEFGIDEEFTINFGDIVTLILVVLIFIKVWF